MWGLITRPVFMDWFENCHVRGAAAHYSPAGLTNDARKCYFRQLFSKPWHRDLLSNIMCMLSTCHLAVHNFVHLPDQEVRKAFKSHDKGEILHKIVAEWNKGVRVQEFPSATKHWKSLIKTPIHGWHNLWPSGSFTARNVSKILNQANQFNIPSFQGIFSGHLEVLQ